MISIKERIEYYLNGNDKNKNQSPPTMPTKVIADVPFRSDINYKDFIPDHYCVDIDRYCSHTQKPLWFQYGDSPVEYKFPIMCKIRDTHSNDVKSNGIISNINTVRHWLPIYYVEAFDMPYSQKKSEVIWRGVSTGINEFKDSQNAPGHRISLNRKDEKYTRLNLMIDYFDKYDIGFSQWVQQEYCPSAKKYLKNPMHMSEILRYKYIITIDGNDKSSALNWVLLSNSVPIMPKPRFNSWLCEPWLIGGVHYIEVKRDFSDLVDKIEWCKSNDKECQEIANNGKKFIIDNFAEPDKETEIEKSLVETLTL